jgi:hypothetical protein
VQWLEGAVFHAVARILQKLAGERRKMRRMQKMSRGMIPLLYDQMQEVVCASVIIDGSSRPAVKNLGQHTSIIETPNAAT